MIFFIPCIPRKDKSYLGLFYRNLHKNYVPERMICQVGKKKTVTKQLKRGPSFGGRIKCGGFWRYRVFGKNTNKIVAIYFWPSLLFRGVLD